MRRVDSSRASTALQAMRSSGVNSVPIYLTEGKGSLFVPPRVLLNNPPPPLTPPSP